jgi:hypothetical protein
MKKYIYTFWTKPYFCKNNLYQNILFLLLSIELTKKISKNIIIYTDWYGELILKKFYSDIEINIELLNSLNLSDTNRWSIPKLYVINKQTQPFCHIDHDIFLWSKINNNSSYDIITQNIEQGSFYSDFYKNQITEYLKYNPINDLFLYTIKKQKFEGYNCGYLDIYNLECSKRWTDFALDLNNNYKNFQSINCTIVEQFSLFAIAKFYNYKIGYLINEPMNNKDLSMTIDGKFTHLMMAKNDTIVFEVIKNNLLKENSSLYNKFIDYSHNLLLK